MHTQDSEEVQDSQRIPTESSDYSQKNYQKWRADFTLNNLNKSNSGRKMVKLKHENIEKVKKKTFLQSKEINSTRNEHQRLTAREQQ